VLITPEAGCHLDSAVGRPLPPGLANLEHLGHRLEVDVVARIELGEAAPC
jgi:hypothetical protein